MNMAVIIVVGLVLCYPVFAFAGTSQSRTDGQVFPLPNVMQQSVPPVRVLQDSMRNAFSRLAQLSPGQGGFQPLSTRLLHVCQHVGVPRG